MGKAEYSDEQLDSSFDLEASPPSDYANLPWHKKKLWTVCIFILVIEAAERCIYYTFSGSQKYFLQDHGFENGQSSIMNSVFTMLCYISPIFGGWLADGYWGRYKTILVFGTIYVVGVLITVTSTLPQIDNQWIYLVGTMVFISVGTGGIKPNVSNFGADQYDVSDPAQAAEQTVYFSYFFWSINFGCILSYTLLINIAVTGMLLPRQCVTDDDDKNPIDLVDGKCPGIEIKSEWSFFVPYAICAGLMACACAVLLMFSNRMIKVAASGDSVRGTIHYLIGGMKTGTRAKLIVASWACMIIAVLMEIVAGFLDPFGVDEVVITVWVYVTLILATIGVGGIVYLGTDNKYMLDVPPVPSLTNEEAIGFFDTIPLLIVGNLGLMVAFNTMVGPMCSQACQCDLRVGGSQIAGSFFNVGDSLGIVLFTPVLENAIYPLIKKFSGVEVGVRGKIVGGFFVAVGGMAIASIFEYIRRGSDVIPEISECAAIVKNVTCYAEDGTESLCDRKAFMSSFSAWPMLVPFSIIGIAETMVLPQLYYISYDQCPPRARSFCMALNLFFCGCLSNCFSAAIMNVLKDSYPNDVNDGNLEYFYYTAAGFSVIMAPITIYLFKQFEVKDFSIKEDTGARRKSTAGSLYHYTNESKMN